MLDNLLLAFQSVATPTGLLYILLGGAAGMILGAIPGLGGGMLTVVLLPVTYKMEPGLALALLMSIYIGSTSGGCIGSILLGIPGTGASIPTCWDGYQFTRKGDPVRALSTAVFCNFIGTLPSLILAVILCPFIANWAVKLGPWEYFSLCFCAVTLVIALSKDDIVKGFISMGLALLMCCLGTDPVGGTQRFTFGNMYMLNGIDMVNLLMGLFAARNILMEYARDTKKKESVSIKVDRFRWPMKDIKEHLPLIFRCFSLGAIIGFMPGLGANTASVLAYSSEKNIAEKKMKKDPTAEGGIKWGEGNIGGVMAPEVANNAVIGGAMTPMIALGIPGNGAMAYFITAMSIHGINAGPQLLLQNTHVVYMLYIAAIIATIVTLISQIVGMPIFPKLLTTPYHFLYPIIIIVAFLGAYLTSNNVFYILVALFACLLGVFMSYFKLPVMPFMMTYILGKLLETNLRRAFNYGEHGLLDFFTRPVSCILLIISFISIIWNLFGDQISEKLRQKKTA